MIILCSGSDSLAVVVDDRQLDRWTDRRTDRQTDRQTVRQKGKQDMQNTKWVMDE